ncbi:MAG: PKD domain-containing protein [Bacteroidia bacterium]|nr:PKD domain-containing protein [Bacteroidia bacterium]
MTQPTQLTVTVNGTPANCSTPGSATAFPNGGVPNYTYQWDGGATGSTAGNLTVGIYCVTVTDANLCTTTGCVTITDIGGITASITSVTGVNCYGGNNGTATVQVNGGTANYTYLWSNGYSTTSTSSTSTVIGLNAGTVTVTITDINGCGATASGVVPPPSQVTVIVTTSTNPTCNEACNGTATVTATGGTPGYTYLWSFGAGSQTSNPAVNLCAGTFSVIVSDVNGCTGTTTVTLTQPLAMSVTTSSSNTDSTLTNGSAWITGIYGGNPGNHTFLWSGGSPNNQDSIGSLFPGQYSVTVTDDIGCTAYSMVVVNPSSCTLNAFISDWADNTCFGYCDGYTQTDVSGGKPPYSFIWSNGNTSQAIKNLCEGMYIVTITDAYGCSNIASVKINQPPLLSVSLDAYPESCYNSDNGHITAYLYGGSSPYHYLWSTLESTDVISGLSNGYYSLTVTDSNNCASIVNASLDSPGLFEINIANLEDAHCGNADGLAKINIIGGIPGYFIEWSNGSNSSMIANLYAGIYTVTVTDGNSCIATEIIHINDFEGPVINNLIYTEPSCFSYDNGTAQVFVIGGTPPYSYVWDDTLNQTNNIAYDLHSGIYTVFITDAAGCHAGAHIIIGQPAKLVSAIVNTANVLCDSTCDGSGTVIVTGGTPPYTYIWSDGQINQTAIDLCAGSYNVITTDANGCTSIDSIGISAPEPIIINGSVTNDLCGNGDGMIIINALGGTPPFSYYWLMSGHSNAIETNLYPGNYVVLVSDDNSCYEISEFNVIKDSSFLTITSQPSNQSGCTGDSILFTIIAEGNGLLTYQWKHNGNFISGNNNDTLILLNITSSDSGSYICLVTDSCSSILSDTANLVVYPVPQVDFVVSNLCEGEEAIYQALCSIESGTITQYHWDFNNDGQVDNISGPVVTFYFGPAQVYLTRLTIFSDHSCSNFIVKPIEVHNQPNPEFYADQLTADCPPLPVNFYCLDSSGYISTWMWNFGDGSPTVNQPQTAYHEYVEPGQYNVNLTLTSIYGCIATYQLDDTVKIGGPVGTIEQSDFQVCKGDTITFNIIDSASIAFIDWDFGDGIVESGSPIVHVYSITGNMTVSLWITSPSGCYLLGDQCTVLVPDLMQISTTGTNATNGNNGSISITISGGSPPYSYLWSNGATTQNISGLAAGTYEVTVTDQNGCTKTASQTVQQLCSLTLVFSKTNATCGQSNGLAMVTATGGVNPYYYAWSNGDTIAYADSLHSGVYMVTVTDNSGCSATGSVTINDVGGAVIEVTSIGHVSCPGGQNGTIDINVSGGGPPYLYEWSTGATTEDLTGLPAGQYTLMVTDTSGCISSESITISEPDAFDVVITTINSTCGIDNGSASATVEGGTSPYIYQWSNGATGATASELLAGVYVLTVTDNNSCYALYNVHIAVSDSSEMVVVVDTVYQAGCGISNGAIYITVTGSVQP